MEELNRILQSSEDQLLGSLDDYQAEIISAFLSATSNDYLQSADNWLNASPSNTAKFGGGTGSSKLYRDKLLEELEKFLCGDAQYEEDRKKLLLTKIRQRDI